MKRSRIAFTLIELLIVVAIIAILAAIAVPNFLEAQVRSKVAAVDADFRSIATALEAYRVDNANYMPSHNSADFIAGTDPLDRFVPLTTPVPYLSHEPPKSPFNAPQDAPAYYLDMQYSTKYGILTWARGGAPTWGANDEGTAYLDGFYMEAQGKAPDFTLLNSNINSTGPEWMLLDRGPDQIFYFIWVNPGWIGLNQAPQNYTQAINLYDPTNGTVSEGEIMRSQYGMPKQ